MSSWSVGDSVWKDEVDLQELLLLMRKRNNVEAKKYMEYLLFEANGRFQMFLKDKIVNELFHIGFMRKCGYPQHDHSKTPFFILAYILHVFVKVQVPYIEEMIETHYVEENHHIEHSKYSREKLPQSAVMEMAADQLARNLELNRGEIKREEMNAPRYSQRYIKSEAEQEEFNKQYQEAIESQENFMTNSWKSLVLKKCEIATNLLPNIRCPSRPAKKPITLGKTLLEELFM